MFALAVTAGTALAQTTQPQQVQTPEENVPMVIKVVKPDAKPFTGKIETAEHLLDALELADKDLRSFRADLIYDKTFDIGGDQQVRWGKLYYVDNKAADAKLRSRKFAINFEGLRIGERRETEPKMYIFDGVWLVEKLPKQKQFIKRQIVGEGESFDPLKIGEGPMPIPIGQRKQDTLARFTAELLPTEEGLMDTDPKVQARIQAHVKGAMQLRLLPIPGTEEARDFREIRLWYRANDTGVLLPVLARTVSRAEDISLVTLSNMAVNPKDLDPALLDTAAPKGADAATWKVDIRARKFDDANVEK
jgi:hypothetical protein